MYCDCSDDRQKVQWVWYAYDIFDSSVRNYKLEFYRNPLAHCPPADHLISNLLDNVARQGKHPRCLYSVSDMTRKWIHKRPFQRNGAVRKPRPTASPTTYANLLLQAFRLSCRPPWHPWRINSNHQIPRLRLNPLAPMSRATATLRRSQLTTSAIVEPYLTSTLIFELDSLSRGPMS